MKMTILILLLLGLIGGCTSINHVTDEYLETSQSVVFTNPSGQLDKGERTVIVFLIDGLGEHLTRKALTQGRLPRIEHYFETNSKGYYLASSVFPSLTFPAISSLLTAQPVEEHQIIGNHLDLDGHPINLESPFHSKELNAHLRSHLLFYRLQQESLKSVSFDYVFYGGATAALPRNNLGVGLSIVNQDYKTADANIISSLQFFLEKVPPPRWPHLIFVHLIGVDLTAHDTGPESDEVLDYLTWLDHQLSPVLKRLKRLESQPSTKITTLLTADHGFDKPFKHFLGTEEEIKNADHRIRIENEGRFLTLRFPEGWSDIQKENYLKSLSGREGVLASALLVHDELKILSGEKTTIVRSNSSLSCSSGFDLEVSQFVGGKRINSLEHACAERFDHLNSNDPYFISSLVHYFRAPNRPDAVILAASGCGFTDKYMGLHGGVTRDEVIVPLMIRNGEVTKMAPHLNEILSFLLPKTQVVGASKIK